MVFGLVKKVFKGVKKAVSKTWKGIKSAFKSIGKFMGKIGIVGQIGLALLLPGVGQILSNMLVGTTGAGGLAGALQGMGAVGKAASGFIRGAVKVATNTSKFFGNITDGVKQIVGDTIGAAAQSLGIGADTAIGKGLTKIGVNMDVDGWGGIFTNAEKSLSNIGSSFTEIFNVDPLSEVTVTATKVGIPEDSLMNEAPLREAIDSESALDALTKETLDTQASFQKIIQDPRFGGNPLKTQIADMTGDVADSLQKSIAQQGGSGTAADPFFASGSTTALTEPKSLLEKTSEFVTGKGIDENIADIRMRTQDKIANFIPETGKAMAKEALYQSVGLSPKPEDFRSVAYGGRVNLPSMEGTSIGTEFMTSPYQSVIQSVSPQFAMANPYGIMAQQYNFNQYAAQLQRTA